MVDRRRWAPAVVEMEDPQMCWDEDRHIGLLRLACCYRSRAARFPRKHPAIVAPARTR